MKSYLFLGLAASILFLTATAQAQSYNPDYAQAKGDVDLTKEGQRIDETSSNTIYPEQYEPEETDQVSRVEPAAGDGEDSEYSDFTGFYAGGDVGYSIG